MTVDELLEEIIAILNRNRNERFLRAVLTRIYALEKAIR